MSPHLSRKLLVLLLAAALSTPWASAALLNSRSDPGRAAAAATAPWQALAQLWRALLGLPGEAGGEAEASGHDGLSSARAGRTARVPRPAQRQPGVTVSCESGGTADPNGHCAKVLRPAMVRQPAVGLSCDSGSSPDPNGSCRP
ncbi:MAG TPA: hypothetical protein VHR45_21670 [Thermoanaerobaculia bacterium]|nr:hypothetical protein [Thermoanaerobaculia bacterium]